MNVQGGTPVDREDRAALPDPWWKRGWRGEIELWKVFWIGGVALWVWQWGIGEFMVAGQDWVLAPREGGSSAVGRAYVLMGVGMLAFVLLSAGAVWWWCAVWRSARQEVLAIWRYLARGIVLLQAVLAGFGLLSLGAFLVRGILM